MSSVRGIIAISEPLPIKENICTATISEGNDNNMITTSYEREQIHSYHQ
jgi:hypothetical protein